mgnify:CR=1 FL=1
MIISNTLEQSNKPVCATSLFFNLVWIISRKIWIELKLVNFQTKLTAICLALILSAIFKVTANVETGFLLAWLVLDTFLKSGVTLVILKTGWKWEKPAGNADLLCCFGESQENEVQ